MKTARSVLNGVLNLSVRHEAIPHNPVRDVGHVSVPTTKTTKRDTHRAFTTEERAELLAYVDADAVAKRHDLPDLLAFMAATGARVGEACGLRWSHLDLDAGRADLGPLPVRVPGVGLVLQEDGKTADSNRTVELPPWLVSRLLARQVEAVPNEWDVVFPSQARWPGTAGAEGERRLRDISNTTKHVWALLDGAGFKWATGHTIRKTVATWMDEAGATDRETANQLGHKRASMTKDVYMSRRTVSTRAASIL
nr:tyrosine-type recombinase/integrase [Modestobacter marinus]